MADEITDLLDSYHASTLWEMAREAGLKVVDAKGKKLPKDPVMAQVRAGFFTRERVLASLAKLNERERATLDRSLTRAGFTGVECFGSYDRAAFNAPGTGDLVAVAVKDRGSARG